MRGDFSRIRFNPAKHYSAVLEQQGRVAVDADGNEQSAIDAHLRDTTNVDVIGPYGGPANDAGFEIDVVGNEIRIGAGRYYVEGLLVENETPVLFDNQPFFINPPYTSQQILNQIAAGKGSVTAHLELEVWQRLVTQLDDACLREPALGQADTTARLQTVWRVVATRDQGTKPFPGQKDAAAGSASFVDPVTQLSQCCQGMYRGISATADGCDGRRQRTGQQHVRMPADCFGRLPGAGESALPGGDSYRGDARYRDVQVVAGKRVGGHGDHDLQRAGGDGVEPGTGCEPGISGRAVGRDQR